MWSRHKRSTQSKGRRHLVSPRLIAMNLLKQIFTWWNGQTIGTRFHTWRFGTRVGQDEFGNV